MITSSIDHRLVFDQSHRAAPLGRNALAVGIVLLAPLLGGSTERWSQGVIFIAIGLLLAANPPQHTPSRGFLLALAGLMGLILAGFLPASWYQIAPWRANLAEAGVELPGTISAQPWVTFESMLLFIGGAAWMSWLAAQRWTFSERITLLRWHAAGVSVFALVALIFYLCKIAPPFWTAREGFGPFPNRNQTSDFLALGGIITLACANHDWRHNHKSWPVWLAGFAVILVALIENHSRAGIVLLAGGTVIWASVLCFYSRALKTFVLGLSGIIFIFSMFLLFGGETLTRFKMQFIPNADGVTDARWLIFKDAFHMIFTNPWNGIGLGNFESVSPFYRDFWRSRHAVIHPESDWLWAAAELGWGAVLLLLAAAGVLLSRVFPLNNVDRRMRTAALLAVLAFACHGLVDVSGHRLGTMIPALFLFGLAMAIPEKASMHPRAPIVFRGCGVLIMAIGLLWLVETLGGGLIPGKTAVVSAKKEALALKKSSQFDASIKKITRAIPWAPLDWELYFSRASARAFSGQWMSALGDFRRARRLHPGAPQLAIAEGKIWLELRPDFALPVWKESLEEIPADQRPGVYLQMVQLAPPNNADLHRELRLLAAGQPQLELILLQRADAEESFSLVQSILSTDPDLKTLDANQKISFFGAWSLFGDSTLLEKKLHENPGWMQAGWRVLALQHVRKEEFQPACELAFQYLEPPAAPKTSNLAPVLTLQRKVYTNPADFVSVYLLYHAQKNLGNQQEALPALKEAAQDPDCPGYIYYCEAILLAARNEWRDAWPALIKASTLAL